MTGLVAGVEVIVATLRVQLILQLTEEALTLTLARDRGAAPGAEAVGHEVTRADVGRVSEVGRIADHGPIDLPTGRTHVFGGATAKHLAENLGGTHFWCVD